MDGLWHGLYPVWYAHRLRGAYVLMDAGYDQGVFSGIVENEDFLGTMGHPGDSLLGIIVSIYNLGCFFGCIVNFVIGDWLGRRRAMWLAMVWVVVRGQSNWLAGSGAAR